MDGYKYQYTQVSKLNHIIACNKPFSSVMFLFLSTFTTLVLILDDILPRAVLFPVDLGSLAWSV
jgi:hypothetical protein